MAYTAKVQSSNNGAITLPNPTSSPSSTSTSENQLKNILNSLSHLADHGSIPVHAFGTLIQTAKSDVITEHLHQKWLSDSNFSRIAAQIVYHFHTIDKYDVSDLTSNCLAHILRDYKSRDCIRAQSRLMYRNFVRTLGEFFVVYRVIDAFLAQSLVNPLFTCLETLLIDAPDDEDVECAAQLIIVFGQLLSEQSLHDATALVMKCRQLLVSNSFFKSEKTNILLLAVSDMWGAGWQRSRLPEILERFHDEQGSFIDFHKRKHSSSSRTVSDTDSSTPSSHSGSFRNVVTFGGPVMGSKKHPDDDHIHHHHLHHHQFHSAFKHHPQITIDDDSIDGKESIV